MIDKSLLKVGSVCAILIGIAKVINSILYLIMPADLRAEVPGKIFLPAFHANPNPLLALFWLEALVGILGLAIIPAVTSLLQGKNKGWLSWGSNLAFAGYAVSAVGYLLSIVRLPAIAKTFVEDPTTQAVLAVTWKASIDLLGVWGYGAIGFWILVVSISAIQNSAFSRWLGILGIVVSIPHLLVPIGAYFKVQPILIGAVVIALITLPAWYIWMGITMRRAAA